MSCWQNERPAGPGADRAGLAQEDVFTRINREYYQLTSSEKKIADYMMLHQQESQILSISDMAEQTGVAEATVSRFCRRLGYEGYNAFKLAVAGARSGRGPSNPLSGEVLPEDTVLAMCQKICSDHVEAIHQTLDLIQPEAITAAADLFLSAGKVLCMGQGGSMILAEEAAHLFSTVLPNFYPVQGSHFQVIRSALLTSSDVVFYFSYSGSTRDMVDVLKTARARGAHSVLITRFPNSNGAAYADIVLECGSRETPLQLGSIAARMAQLYLVDVLFSEVCRRDMAEARSRRKQVADALADKHM